MPRKHDENKSTDDPADTTPAHDAEFLTIGKAASYLGVSVSTMRNWDRQGKLPARRHPINQYRIYPLESLLLVRKQMSSYGGDESTRSVFQAESRFDVSFVAPMSLAEKQIQQSYRPYIQVHKWFARRPGTLFRALLLAEFGEFSVFRDAYYKSNDIRGFTVLDPFIGGGTPVLEANRLGMNVVGCDINPMAAWIVRQELASLDTAELRRCSKLLVAEVERQIGHMYQTACKICGGDASVKYFIWVKTLACPACNEDIKLFPGYLVASNARHPNYVLVCRECAGLFEVSELPKRGDQVHCSICEETWENTPVAYRNRYTCSHCGHEGKYPADLASRGVPRHTMVAIEYHCPSCKPNHKGRFFKAPGADDIERYNASEDTAVSSSLDDWVPDELVPAGDETTRLHRWGYRRYRDLFNARQLLSLSVTANSIAQVPDDIQRHALATVFSDFLRYQNMLGRYDTYALKCQDIFSVHGFPVGLVQCENNVLGIERVGAGGFQHFVEKYINAKEYNLRPFEVRRSGSRKQKIYATEEHIGGVFTDEMPGVNAVRTAWISRNTVESLDIPPESVDAVITDPPYYDNVQYAELMDFCYVWLRRLINGEFSEFQAESTRSAAELTGNRTAGRDLLDFTGGLSSVYTTSARALKPGGLFAFTYHHNNPSAYLPVVVALLDAGLVATASIPCPAEMAASLHIARTGSSVVDSIICSRKASDDVQKKDMSLLEIPELLQKQHDALTYGGVEPTDGDLRCMVLGLLTVYAVNRLSDSWVLSIAIADRLALASRFMENAIDQLGGMDSLIRVEKPTETHPSPPQLVLFSAD